MVLFQEHTNLEVDSDTVIGGSGPKQEEQLRAMLRSCFSHVVVAEAGSAFMVRHHHDDVLYDCSRWSLDARRRSARFEIEPLLLAIKQLPVMSALRRDSAPAVRHLIKGSASSRLLRHSKAVAGSGSGAGAKQGAAGLLPMPLRVPVGEEPAAGSSGAAPTILQPLCKRPPFRSHDSPNVSQPPLPLTIHFVFDVLAACASAQF